MVTKEDLQKKYAKLDTVDLLEINANKTDYTELAAAVALEEIKRRRVSSEDIKNYKSAFNVKPDDKTIENYFLDLNFFQKLGYYFLLIPIYNRRLNFFSSFKKSFEANGYVLKLQQGNYYLVAGVSFLIVSGISLNFSSSSFFYIWISGFAVSYLFDIGFNKDRQINDLHVKVEEGKDPREF